MTDTLVDLSGKIDEERGRLGRRKEEVLRFLTELPDRLLGVLGQQPGGA
jgi:hypothetical protein